MVVEEGVLAIQGMTCSNCSGAIEKHVSSLEGVQKCVVSLLTEQAVVTFDPQVVKLPSIAEEVEDIGFGAEVMQTDRSNVMVTEKGSPHAHDRKEKRVRCGVLAVGGMTCSNCSSGIEKHLSGLDGVLSVSVSLLTEQCEVTFDPTVITLEQMAEEVEDIGFDASVPSQQPTAPGTGGGDVAQTGRGETCVLRFVVEDPVASDMDALCEWAVQTIPAVDGCSWQPEVLVHRSAVKPLDSTAAADDVGLDQESALRRCSQLHVSFTYRQLRHSASELGSVIKNHAQITAESKEPSAQDTLSAAMGADGGPFGLCDLVRDFLARVREHNPRVYLTHLVNDSSSLLVKRAVMKERQVEECLVMRRRFCFAFAFCLPLLLGMALRSSMPKLFLFMPFSGSVSLMDLLSLALASMVQWVAWPIYRSAWLGLVHRHPSMDLLVALGALSGYVYSLVAVAVGALNGGGGDSVTSFFESGAMLLTIILMGRYVEHKVRGHTLDALTGLMELAPAVCSQVPGYWTPDHPDTSHPTPSAEVPSAFLGISDVVVCAPGDSFPADGVVLRGSTAVDERMMTGESLPVEKQCGDAVRCGSVNVDNEVVVLVCAVGPATYLRRVIQLVENAQTAKASLQLYVDQIAGYFVPAVVVLAAVVAVGWLAHEWLVAGADSSQALVTALLRGIAVLVVSCPCSLGLATPTAVMVGTSLGAMLGILFKGGAPVEAAGRSKVVLFDKTGTLTMGDLHVNQQSSWVSEPGVAGALRELAIQSPATHSSNWVIAGTKDAQSAGTNLLQCGASELFWSLVVSTEAQSDHLIAQCVRRLVLDQPQHSGALLPSHVMSGPGEAGSGVSSLCRVAVRFVEGKDAPPSTHVDGDLVFSLPFPDHESEGKSAVELNRVYTVEVPVVVGNASYLAANHCSMSFQAHSRLAQISEQGSLSVCVGVASQCVGVLALSDPLRPDAVQAVAALQARGVWVGIVSGDTPASAQWAGRQLGIPSSLVFGGVPVSQKGVLVDVCRRLAAEDQDQDHTPYEAHTATTATTASDSGTHTASRPSTALAAARSPAVATSPAGAARSLEDDEKSLQLDTLPASAGFRDFSDLTLFAEENDVFAGDTGTAGLSSSGIDDPEVPNSGVADNTTHGASVSRLPAPQCSVAMTLDMEEFGRRIRVHLDQLGSSGSNDTDASESASHADANKDRWSVSWVCGRREPRRGVAFVGDGINDAVALKSADVGVSFGRNSAVASEAASIIIPRPDLLRVIDCVDLSQATVTRIRHSLLWSLCYNAVMVPLAAGVFGRNTHLSPSLAALAMGLSSLVVVCSALWLWRFRPRSELTPSAHAPGDSSSVGSDEAGCCGRTLSMCAFLCSMFCGSGQISQFADQLQRRPRKTPKMSGRPRRTPWRRHRYSTLVDEDPDTEGDYK